MNSFDTIKAELLLALENKDTSHVERVNVRVNNLANCPGVGTAYNWGELKQLIIDYRAEQNTAQAKAIVDTLAARREHKRMVLLQREQNQPPKEEYIADDFEAGLVSQLREFEGAHHGHKRGKSNLHRSKQRRQSQPYEF